jgi:hypothetical protein
MALVVKDRVQETSTTTGTGTITLAGAVSGFQSFSAIGNGNTTYYSITDGTNWEVGVGTYTSSGTTLSRDTVLESSNSDNLVNFGAGSKFVFCTYPADKSVYADASNKVSGYAIENSTIGATTATTGKFTSVTTPSVTATTTDLTLSAISTGAVLASTANGTAFSITDSGATATAFVQVASGGSGQNGAYVRSNGSATNPNLYLQTKGTGSVNFYSNSLVSAAQQFSVGHTASAVNYVQVTGSATGVRPSLTVAGSDATIGLNIAAKGGEIVFLNNGVGTNAQFSTTFTAASVNYLTATGSGATGNAPRLYAQGSDTNISMAFQPKGTGAIDLSAGSSGVNISNGGTVTAITRTAVGNNYTSFPSIAISAPTTAGGVQATATVTGMTFAGSNATVVNGGTGYTVGNVLTVVGTTPASALTLTVATVSGGVITSATHTNFGTVSVLPPSPYSVTGGSGSGATFTSVYQVASQAISNAGSGYIEQPTITFSGGGGSGAAAYATVGSGTTVKSIGSTMSFNTPNGETVRISDNNATAVNYWAFNAGTASANPLISVGGSGTNISQTFNTKGTGVYQFSTGSALQYQIAHTASAVNYVQVTGNVTTGPVTISAQGSDGNVSAQITTKGTGSLSVFSNNGSNRQFRVDGTTTAVNYLDVYGSIASSAPSLRVAGTDTDIDLSLTPKGTGLVRFGTYVAGALLATGYINIKAADGTTYKVLVST